VSARALTIVGLGDSTTAGTPGFLSPLEVPPDGSGDSESQYAHWMRTAHPEWTVLNRGVDGERSDGIRARFERDVLGERPDYVIVLAGVNDLHEGRPVASVQAHLAAMYAEAIDAGIVPVAATVLPYDEATRPVSAAIWELNDWIKFVAASLGIPYCDTHAAVADPEDPTRLRGSPDGLHPDVEGYRRMGEALARAIEADLARRAHPTSRPD